MRKDRLKSEPTCMLVNVVRPHKIRRLALAHQGFKYLELIFSYQNECLIKVALTYKITLYLYFSAITHVTSLHNRSDQVFSPK